MRRRRFTGTVAYFLILGQLILPLAAGCGRDSTNRSVQSSAGGIAGGVLQGINIGEVVFRVTRAQLAASPVRGSPRCSRSTGARGRPNNSWTGPATPTVGRYVSATELPTSTNSMATDGSSTRRGSPRLQVKT